jgi:Uma2 family endonuclease
MLARLAVRDYVLDPADPRAPTVEQWERMSPDERRRVVDMLPAEVPEDLFAPEGDLHRKAKSSSLDALETHFRRTGRKAYLSSELSVYYPGEPRFAPDVLAVLDVEPHDRATWVVESEGKGLDFVLEVHVAGDKRKDQEANVERYARLGILEYFIFDRGRLRLHGHRLPSATARAYRPILPQEGRYASQVLGLDLTLDGEKLRFFLGGAPLPESDEMIAKLGSMLNSVITHKEEAERRAEELEQRLADEQRLRAEERAEAERKLAEALAEIERLKSSR